VSASTKTLGLDLGGTKIAAAVVEAGKILASNQLPTPQSGFDDVIEALCTAAAPLLEGYPDIDRIGIGSPGPLDLDKGEILFAPNIAGMTNAPIVERLQARLDRRVVLENDANAAGYAEHLYGAARALESSIFVTISTGIGGGIFVREEIVHGATGSAGEIGHMTLSLDGPLCGCGHFGCWEALASGRAIAREASFSYGSELTTKEVFARAQRGERKALAVIERAARFTGLGLANLHKAFDPDGFVIGGGMSQVGAFYLDRIEAAAKAFTVNFPPIKLYPAQLGTDAGVIGAAAVAARGMHDAGPTA
jgi:glucokinase